MSSVPRAGLRLRAPELTGRGWLNTGGSPVRLADLRGHVVVLDFWTFCCVNCLHVLDELRPLEREFGDRLVVIGVHSPKFEHEGDPQALAAAVERYGVAHPVLDDADLTTWGAYTARAWPTLVVIDPQGYVVATLAGEGHAEGLRRLISELVAEHAAAGTLAAGPGPYVPSAPEQTPLRFPAKALVLPDGSVLVSDTTHHRIVQLEPDLSTERAAWGGPGLLNEPQGLALLPDEVTAQVGADVAVADTVGHRIMGLRWARQGRPADAALTLLAGTGDQLRETTSTPDRSATEQPLSSPWDVVWWHDRLVIAMSGTHQLWEWRLAPDGTGHLAVLAGTGAEGIRDGDGEQAWFAQPSGLAVDPDGVLWVADAETSALRSVRRAGGDAVEVRTHIGQGLFDFGHRDGPADQALLQHPLGVSVLPDGTLAISDTYNGALRRYDPRTDEVSTLVGELREPSDAVPVVVDGQAHLVLVESAAHELVRVGIPEAAQLVDGLARTTERPPTRLASGRRTLRVRFTPPTGQHLDDRFGDPTWLSVSATPEAFLRSGAGAHAGLTRELDLDAGVGSGILHIAVRAASCDGDPDTGQVPEHAACHVYRQDWGIPVVLAEDGDRELILDLRGVHD